MNIPTLKPEQFLLFSSQEDSFGIGNIIPVKVKDITSWVHTDDAKEVKFIESDDGEDELYHLPYYDFVIMPIGWVPDYTNDAFEQETIIKYLTSK